MPAPAVPRTISPGGLGISPIREQRRLAAILAADVVGYSRLMGRDESGTLARLREHRQLRLEPALARYGGRLVKLTGDGALVEFASAVDALKAALEFQQAMAAANDGQPADTAIVFRIGLHLGDLIVEGDDLYGDGVNVAARLEGEAPPGGIVISGNLHDAVVGRLEAAFADLGDLALKNIERPVRAYRVVENSAATAPAAPSAPAALAQPDKPSIAVLPFQNMSGDPEQEYFADGMVEDIITALSRFKSLFVIARNSSFTYKGRAVDIKQVGRELGVRYVLEGSVRKAGNRVRITGQLIDASNGTHIWADRFEGGTADVFSLQDEMTERVIAAIAPAIEQVEIERARQKQPSSLTAHDLYLRASATWWRAQRDTSDEIVRLLRHALEIDPNHAMAGALLLAVHAVRRTVNLADNSPAERQEVEALIKKILSSKQDDAASLGYAAFAIAVCLRDLPLAAEKIARALALNPNLSDAWAFSGYIQTWSGNPALAVDHFARAWRLDPLNGSGNWKSGLAHTYFFLDRHEEALNVAQDMMRTTAAAHASLRIGAAAASFAGKMDVAREFGARLHQLDPSLRVSDLARYLGPYPPALLEKYQQGLRLAGLPE